MDKDALIAKIATRHGVALSPDDPVMILTTLNEELLEENAKAHTQLLMQLRKEMAGAAEAWSAASRAQAQALLQQTLAGSTAVMAKTAAGVLDELLTQARTDLARIERAENRLTWLMAANMAAGFVTFAAACLAWVRP